MAHDTPICATVEGFVLSGESKAVRQWSKIDVIGQPAQGRIVCQCVNPDPVEATGHGMSSQSCGVTAKNGETQVIVRQSTALEQEAVIINVAVIQQVFEPCARQIRMQPGIATPIKSVEITLCDQTGRAKVVILLSAGDRSKDIK